jgi:predicted DsbA family dithiol-disulfide isomerase
LASLPWADEVEVRWRAYQLDPRATNEPRDVRGAIERKYGPGAYDSMTQRFALLGEQEGLTYRFDQAKRVNTVDAHRLLAWAWDTQGATGQDMLKERLFRAYFEDGANVADADELTRMASEVGLDADRAREIVDGDAYSDDVRADLVEAAERELMGVPAFLVDGLFMIPGAQEVETMRAIFERARHRQVSS